MKKLISLIAAISLSACVFAGCGRNNVTSGDNGDNEVSSKGKTTLSIGVFDGGLGSDWVYAIKKRFEAKYANHSFEEGKQGVSIRVVPSRTFTSTGMEENMSEMKEEVIFAEGASAYHFAERGDFLDITDVVTSSLQYDFVTKQTDSSGEAATIESKLNAQQKAYFSSIGGKYYAIPSTEKFYGIAYDIEFFETNNLFFAKNGGFVTSATAERGTGPDGKLGTYDDGLPATYDDFFTLTDKIASLPGNPIPVMWGGSVQEYVSDLLVALAADYVGAEQAELNYNFSGTLKNPIVSFSNGNPVLGEDIEITAQTGYNTYKSAGKYYALKFLERLVSDSKRYNSNNATDPAFTHQDAEGSFVSGKYIPQIKRTAMLIDGCWWQSESKGVFTELAAEFGDEASLKNRKFGLMPLPKADSDHLGDYTVLSLTGDIGFINKNCAANKVDLAKAFLQFCFTNESCVEYTMTTNICRPVAFDMGDKYNELSSWGQMVVDVHNNAVKAYQDSDSKIMRNYSVDLWYSPNLWLSNVNGTTYTLPTKAMIDSGVTAEQYFNGLSTYWTPSVWTNKFTAI